MSRRHSYPAECPVFEVVDEGEGFLNGRIVVGVGPAERVYYCGHQCIGVVVPDSVLGCNLEWLGFNHFNLRPLTRSAREMLALVKS